MARKHTHVDANDLKKWNTAIMKGEATVHALPLSDVHWSSQTGDRPGTYRLFSGFGSSRVLIFIM